MLASNLIDHLTKKFYKEIYNSMLLYVNDKIFINELYKCDKIFFVNLFLTFVKAKLDIEPEYKPVYPKYDSNNEAYILQCLIDSNFAVNLELMLLSLSEFHGVEFENFDFTIHVHDDKFEKSKERLISILHANEEKQ